MGVTDPIFQLCEGGCGCLVGTDDPKASECGCLGPCTAAADLLQQIAADPELRRRLLDRIEQDVLVDYLLEIPR